MDAMPRLIAFAIVSLAILLLSRESLRDPRSHGFPRFFAFELLLILILLNVPRWFADPLSARQIVSWLLLLTSLLLAAHGFHLLRRAGRPKGGIERTTALVTVGAYGYIRHPLYASLLLLAWGAFLKDPSLLGGALAVATNACLAATAKVEEAENLRRFGADYAAYMKHTRRFVPFVF